jgi:hypothetical protein
MGLYRVEVMGIVDWPDPPIEFADRSSAIGHAKGLVGRLLDLGAGDEVSVSVRVDDTTEATYSVAGWRLTLMILGDKAYS